MSENQKLIYSTLEFIHLVDCNNFNDFKRLVDNLNKYSSDNNLDNFYNSHKKYFHIDLKNLEKYNYGFNYIINENGKYLDFEYFRNFSMILSDLFYTKLNFVNKIAINFFYLTHSKVYDLNF